MVQLYVYVDWGYSTSCWLVSNIECQRIEMNSLKSRSYSHNMHSKHIFVGGLTIDLDLDYSFLIKLYMYGENWNEVVDSKLAIHIFVGLELKDQSKLK